MNKACLYTSTIGSYVAWNNNVDLGPPHPGTAVPDEDKNIMTYYDALQYTLYETGFPETETRQPAKNVDYTDQVTLAVLSSPVECMGLLLEGLFSLFTDCMGLLLEGLFSLCTVGLCM